MKIQINFEFQKKSYLYLMKIQISFKFQKKKKSNLEIHISFENRKSNLYLMKIQISFKIRKIGSVFNENTDQFCVQKKKTKFVFNEKIDQF